VGVAKIAINELAALVDRVHNARDLKLSAHGYKPLREDISERLMFRLALDDLKAYYIEAALTENTNPSSKQVYDWLWLETLFGKTMRELRKAFMRSEDKKTADLGARFIVPHDWRD